DPAETAKLRQVERLIRQKLTVAKDLTGAPVMEGEKLSDGRPKRGAGKESTGFGNAARKPEGSTRPKFGQPKREHGGTGRGKQKHNRRPSEGGQQRRAIRAA